MLSNMLRLIQPLYVLPHVFHHYFDPLKLIARDFRDQNGQGTNGYAMY